MRQHTSQNKRPRRLGRKTSADRSYESTGPTGKIRGAAAHIVARYQQLASDAQAARDWVGMENYLQHAEHYARIVFAQSQEKTFSQKEKESGDSECTEDHFPDGSDGYSRTRTSSRANRDVPEAPGERQEKEEDREEETQSLAHSPPHPEFSPMESQEESQRHRLTFRSRFKHSPKRPRFSRGGRDG